MSESDTPFYRGDPNDHFAHLEAAIQRIEDLQTALTATEARAADLQTQLGEANRWGYSADAQPRLYTKHIDGPLLISRSGELHWLTWRERFLLWIGRTDAGRLERERFPHLFARTRTTPPDLVSAPDNELSK